MKRVVSIILALTMALLMLTTGIASVSAVSVANITVNGKTTKAAVGSTVTYKVDLTAARIFENIQAIVNYDAEMLQLTRIKSDDPDVEDWEVEGPAFCPNLEGVILNADTEGVVKFNASKVAGYNFKEEKNLVTLEFKVKDTTANEIALNIEEMTIKGGEESYFTDSMPEITKGITVSEYLIADPIPANPSSGSSGNGSSGNGSSGNGSSGNGSSGNGSSGSGSSGSGSSGSGSSGSGSSGNGSSGRTPAEKEETTAPPVKTATMNNIEVEVGDTVSYTFFVEKMTDVDVRKITGITICTFFDQKALELVSVSADNLKGTTVINDNQNKDGQIVVSNSMINGLEGLDIDSRVSFFTATFKVKEAVKSEITYYVPYMYDIHLDNITNYKLTYDLKAKDTGSSVTEETPVLVTGSNLSKIADIGDFVNTEEGYSYPNPTEPTETTEAVMEESEYYEFSPVVPEKAETAKGIAGVSGVLGILLIIGVVLLVILGGIIAIAVPVVVIIIIVVCVKKKKKKALSANSDMNIANNDNING